jgi:1,4-dihydroxy-2-naphthoyl-CoA hydrolase
MTGPDQLAVPGDELAHLGELASSMGVKVTEATKERVVGTMPVAGNRQPYGLLHGGANAVLAETLGSVHAALLARAGRIVVGIDLNCTHHRSATDGTVTGVCTPLQAGRTVSSFEIVITDETGRRLCTSRLTCISRDAG